MLREIALFGALAPSLLLYFLAAILVFIVLDRMVARLGVYRFLWHPPLARVRALPLRVLRPRVFDKTMR